MNYMLTNQDLTVTFSSHGAQIISIKDTANIEYLWQGDPTYWSGQSPIMFPICGSLRNQTATIGKNKTCTMGRHGIVKNQEFTYSEQTTNSITFSLSATEELKKQYPYDFTLAMTYTLIGKTLEMKFSITNHTSEQMPFFTGGHPAFNCPILPGESYEDYQVEFEKPETAHCPASVPDSGLVDTDKRLDLLDNEQILPLKHELFAVDGLIFDTLQSRSVKLINPKTGKGIQEDFADFNYLVLWSSTNHGPYLAMEPWTGFSTCEEESDIFEEKRGVRILPAKGSTSLAFQITVL